MQECPCSSGKPLDQCCGPIIAGESKAATPEDLMRARYSAHVLGKTGFLLHSLHPDVRGGVKESDLKAPENVIDWRGLEVEEISGGTADDVDGEVIFTARYAVQGVENVHRERAFFHKDNGEWFYLDGEVDGHTPYRREEAKVGRNDPCPCGSGKKFKKCCGAA